MKRTRALPWLLLCLGAQSASAGGYSCANGARLYLENGRERCDDGGMPIYRADTVAPVSATTITPPTATPAVSRVEGLRCTKTLRCADRSGEGKVLIDGTFPERTGATVRAELIRTDTGAVVNRAEAVLPEGGFLGFKLPLATLAPADYQFRLVSDDNGKVLGKALFTLAGTGQAARPEPPRPQPQPVDTRPAPSPSPSEAMARGVRISGVDCRGVDCEVAEGMQAGLATLNLSGGHFSAYDGQALRVVTLDSRNRVGDERNSGVINGRIDLAIPAWRLAGGSYRFEVKPKNTEKVLASGAFAVAQGKDEMKPAEPRPNDRPPPTKAGPSMAGLYWCVAPSWSKGTILLNPDGSYDMNGNRAGRYTVSKAQVGFDGQLKGWNNGVARIEDGNLIFEWKNPDGSMQYYAYAKGKD